MSSDFKFVPPASFVQPSFWNKLSELKINVDKLRENDHDIFGFFSNVSGVWGTHVVEVDSTSFNTNFNNQLSIPFHGKIFNKNTIEQFRDLNKTDLINQEGEKFLQVLKNEALETPSKLNWFFILSFSDLKKFHFYYWFAFPVPHNLEISLDDITPIQDNFSQEEIISINNEYLKLDEYQKPYFIIKNRKIETLQSGINSITVENFNEYFFAFSDFLNQGRIPKSQLKNFILLILHHCPFLQSKTLKFVLIHLNKNRTCEESLVYKLKLPNDLGVDSVTNWVGWEKNEKNKFAPRFSNMKSSMDPQTLFEESVDLNLKLMKWRLLPDLNLDKIRSAKCLLLGAGTLGCSVARNLLGWGVRNITFVDNSKVSYSNPVRQHLFTYEDAINSRPKAVAAALNLKKIFPSIIAEAQQFTIPMPGHSVGETDLETVKNSVDQLIELIESHEVIFLLTDSRESRWLPTLLGVTYNKIVINVALGFDSYLVMRFGGNVSTEIGEFPGIQCCQLGCYFCNDVTAPGNSLKDRTLDQQCTVTRPGVSSIAGALAVELLISILQHKDGAAAPAFFTNEPDDKQMGILGIIPHSIRGFLSSYNHILPATPKYSQCIACSKYVVDAFKSRNFDFLLDVFNSSSYLEEITGLRELLEACNEIEVLEISSDSEMEN